MINDARYRNTVTVGCVNYQSVRGDRPASPADMQRLIFNRNANANRVGTEHTINYYEASTVAGPDFPTFTRIHAQSGRDDEIASITLSFNKLDRFRSAPDLGKLRRADVISSEIKQLDAEQQHCLDIPPESENLKKVIKLWQKLSKI